MLRLPIAVFAVVGFTGCLSHSEYIDDTGYEQEGARAVSFVGAAVLSGDIGPVKSLGNNVTLSGSDDGACTLVTLEGVGKNGAGSMMIDVMPRADDMDDGRYAVGVTNDTYEGTTVDSQADTNDGAHYDASADGGHVLIKRLPNGDRQVEVLAQYGDSKTSSLASFTVHITPANAAAR